MLFDLGVINLIQSILNTFIDVIFYVFLYSFITGISLALMVLVLNIY